MTHDVEVLISGGGIAGMVATLAFSRAGFTTLCVDPGPAGLNTDGRTTAFLQPSQVLLDEIGVWSDLSKDATPLQVMAIADLGADGRIKAHRSFDAAEVSDAPFGWNLPNTAIRSALIRALDDHPNARVQNEITSQAMLARDAHARVRLSDSSLVTARLVVAADGRNSHLRQITGIGLKTWRYGQKALVFSADHEKPHNATSAEVHRTGGPFTLVPLPDAGGTYRSSVVWMERGPEAARLAGLTAQAFMEAANERSGGILGHLRTDGPPQVWPIIAQRAERITDQRLALIGEAAHVIPPIGAQGLNMSLTDIRSLRDLAVSDPAGLGSDKMLDAYSKARSRDIQTRITGIDALNRASLTGSPLLRNLRAEAMKLIHDVGPVRKGLMRAGLGNRP